MSDLREALLDLRSQHGALTPKIVLAAAREDDHPLHAYAAWKWDDDEAAAEAYRLSVARDLIRFARVSYVDPKTKEARDVRAFHAVRQADASQYDYVDVDEVMADDFKRKLVMNDMQRQIDEMIGRYEHFQEFWRLWKKALRDRAS